MKATVVALPLKIYVEGLLQRWNAVQGGLLEECVKFEGAIAFDLHGTDKWHVSIRLSEEYHSRLTVTAVPDGEHRIVIAAARNLKFMRVPFIGGSYLDNGWKLRQDGPRAERCLWALHDGPPPAWERLDGCFSIDVRDERLFLTEEGSTETRTWVRVERGRKDS